MSPKTDILDTAAVAKEMKVSQRRVQQFIDEGRLPAIRVGKTYGVRRGDIAKFKPLKRGPKGKKAGKVS